jgi:ABC-type nitrate/sulfonate/bicarbonate transport system ATPase subunit
MPWLTVLEHVRLVIDGPGTEEERAMKSWPAICLEEMDLGDVMDAFPNRLSAA